jgi:ketosteroid isomerase-like protein
MRLNSGDHVRFWLVGGDRGRYPRVMRQHHIAHRVVIVTLAVLLGAPALARADSVSRIVEIRSYNLKPGTRDHFQHVFVTDVMPLLARWKVDVVSFGPSPADADSWYLMRGYASLEERQKSEDAFYGSDDWKKGPRAAILAAIDTYATIVIPVDEATLRGLRNAGVQGTAVAGQKTAAEIVAALDTEYQAAVKRNDAATMDRILADDFVLVTGRGQTFTKTDLLTQARTTTTVYEHQEEIEQKVRVWGDTAVVTALLWIKGATAGTVSDRKLWFSDTYVRTPAGWKYVFGQASLALP